MIIGNYLLATIWINLLYMLAQYEQPGNVSRPTMGDIFSTVIMTYDNKSTPVKLKGVF